MKALKAPDSRIHVVFVKAEGAELKQKERLGMDVFDLEHKYAVKTIGLIYAETHLTVDQDKYKAGFQYRVDCVVFN